GSLIRPPIPVLNAGYAITVNGNLTAAVARQNNKNCRCGIWATIVRTEAEDRQNAARPHGVKNDRHFPSQCGSGTFEAEPLPQHEAPTAERTFLTDPRQEHSGSFVKQSAQLAITTPRDVAVVVHFSRLEAPRCKPEPGTNRARPLEGIGP